MLRENGQNSECKRFRTWWAGPHEGEQFAIARTQRFNEGGDQILDCFLDGNIHLTVSRKYSEKISQGMREK